MNVVILSGRLTKDTSLNPSGKVADNCLAVDRRYKDADGERQTDFHNLRWIGEKRAQFAQQYMTKGTKIIVSGSSHIDSYKDKDGKNRQYHYILVDEVEFAGSKSNGNNKNGNSDHPIQNQPETPIQQQEQQWMNIPDGIDEKLPFS